MLQAFRCKTKPCRFVTRTGNKLHPIMLGLCPPAKSVATKPMANPTSTLCRAALQIDFLNWVDLLEASPEEKHEDVDQPALHRLVESDPTIAADAYRRMRLATGGAPGAVGYISGRTPGTAWEQVRPTGGVVLASVVGVRVVRYQDLIVVEGGPHPSAALRGNKVITERFQRAMRVLRACLDLDPVRRVAATPSEWAVHINKSLGEADHTARLSRIRSRVASSVEAMPQTESLGSKRKSRVKPFPQYLVYTAVAAGFALLLVFVGLMRNGENSEDAQNSELITQNQPNTPPTETEDLPEPTSPEPETQVISPLTEEEIFEMEGEKTLNSSEKLETVE